ncbi:hypothetical protein [Streptomyces sp. NPDC046939]|uniref:hypothetical protein n=1 Tax=Streptomyces sp. NPDC046939 TaxID=3155376 RepID=UPI0033E1212E
MPPDRNPFPLHATMTLDALAAYRLDDFPTSLSRIPLERLLSIQRRYVQDPAAGRAVALHGPHGSGKTHTLLVALATAHAGGPPVKPCIVLYVRADGPDPLLLYRKLMSRWTLSELTELAEQAFAGYAMDEFIASRTPEGGETADTRRLRDNPHLVRQAIRDNELSYTAVADRVEHDIRRIQGRYGAFERVLRSLSNPALRQAAHRWLLAEDVSDEERIRLGVPGAIDQPSDIRKAIHVLATLARRAGRPFTLAMDQMEAFLRTSDGRIDGTNAGLLRGVVEDLVQENAFMVAAVAEQVWQEMPLDLRQRFGPSEICMPELSVVEAEDVLAAYLAPWPPEPGQPRTFPFLPDAVRQLLAESGGNIRRFLQASQVVFGTWQPDSPAIDATAVRTGLNSAGGDRAPDECAVRRAVEETLQKFNRPFRTDYVVDGQAIEFAVLSGDRVVLAVEVIEAVFGQDEAIRAAHKMEKIHALRRHRPAIVLVVVGYSSPDVRNKLREAAGHVLTASSRGFAAELEQALMEAAPEAEHLDLDVLDERLERLRQETVTLIQQRSVDEHLVATRFQQITTQRSVSQWKEQLQRFRLLWLQEREHLEQEVNRRQAQRRQNEVAEIVQLHDDHVRRLAARSRLRRDQELAMLISATLLLFAFATYIALVLSVPSSLPVVAAVIGIVVLPVPVILRRRQQDVPAGERVRSMDDLNRLARHEATPDVFGRDAFDRFSAIVSRHIGSVDAEALLRAAHHEPSALIRRALITEAVVRAPELMGQAVASGAYPADLSGAVEACPDSGGLWEAPTSLRVLALLRLKSLRDHERPPSPPPFAQRTWLEQFTAAIATAVTPVPPSMSRLVLAYERDDDELLADAIRDVTERDLRQATSVLLSAGDEGLVGYYWLDSRDTVHDLYVFLRKALYFLAGGVERPPSGDAPVS